MITYRVRESWEDPDDAIEIDGLDPIDAIIQFAFGEFDPDRPTPREVILVGPDGDDFRRRVVPVLSYRIEMP